MTASVVEAVVAEGLGVGFFEGVAALMVGVASGQVGTVVEAAVGVVAADAGGIVVAGLPVEVVAGAVSVGATVGEVVACGVSLPRQTRSTLGERSFT